MQHVKRVKEWVKKLKENLEKYIIISNPFELELEKWKILVEMDMEKEKEEKQNYSPLLLFPPILSPKVLEQFHEKYDFPLFDGTATYKEYVNCSNSLSQLENLKYERLRVRNLSNPLKFSKTMFELEKDTQQLLDRAYKTLLSSLFY